MRVFYAGDSGVDGPARYLLGILKYIGAKVTHIPPGNKIQKIASRSYDLFIFSDFSYRDLSQAAEQQVTTQVENGAGLLMVGGWGSFSGPFGGWKKSKLVKLLPVICQDKDDRTNFPGGAVFCQEVKGHPVLKGLSFSSPPAICGLNRVKLKTGTKQLLSLKSIQFHSQGNVSLSSKSLPLLVVQETRTFRSAAYSSDFAPHWCSGFVDWGTKTMKIKIQPGVEIQVGNAYVRLISQLLQWLANKI